MNGLCLFFFFRGSELAIGRDFRSKTAAVKLLERPSWQTSMLLFPSPFAFWKLLGQRILCPQIPVLDSTSQSKLQNYRRNNSFILKLGCLIWYKLGKQ